MKNSIILFLILALVVTVFWSCNKDNVAESANNAPTCKIISPAADTTFVIGNNIIVEANADDSDGNILEVRFYLDEDQVGVASDSPYSYSIPADICTPGTHIIKVIAEDNDGAETENQITINLTTTQNSPPVISSITANPTSVGRGETSTITCNATDTDIDNILIYTWEKTGGTLTSNGSTTTWTAPDNLGSYTITCIVSDGELTDTETTLIYVTEGGSQTDMVFVQGGTFLMGDSFNEGTSDEGPLHYVTVSSFDMGVTEVTNQYYCNILNYALDQGIITASTSTVNNNTGNTQALLDLDNENCRISYNGLNFEIDAGFANYPVTEVTWYGSAFYCNMESRRMGMNELYDLADWSCNWYASGYRLPTEAE